MDKMSIIAGKCTCGRKLDIRMTSPEDMKIKQLWTINGHCKKCNTVYLQAIYEYEPRKNIDYLIELESTVEVTNDV